MVTLTLGLVPKASTMSWVLGALGLYAHLSCGTGDKPVTCLLCLLPFQVSTLLQAPIHPWATTSRGLTHQGPTLALGVTQPQSWSLQGLPPR